jgi:hypothetical protein
MAIQNNFPNIRPTLNLNFALSKRVDPRITFVRSTTATYFDQDGILQTAAANQGRITFDPATLDCQGLLIEEQRTNNVLQSEDFATTWTATGATVSINAATAPSGALTADKLVEDSSTGSHLVTQNITYSAVTYTASVFAKKAERDWIRVLFFDGTNTFSAFFNLNTGVVGTVSGAGASAAIQNVGNGWYRCLVTATTAAGAGTFAPRVALADNNSSYTGSTGSGIFIWGAQLEAGAFPTSYIPTTTTALTRNADVASMTGTNFSSWYNATEGTFVTQTVGQNIASGATGVIAGVDDGTGSNRIIVAYSSPISNLFRVVSSGSDQANFTVGAISSGAISKMACVYKANDFAGTVNAQTVQTDTSGTVPLVNTFRIGVNVAASASANVSISRIAYYPVRVTDAQLQALTG